MEVEVPGRPPVVLKEVLPGLTMAKRKVYRWLNEHFSDPDREPLTYSVTVSDSAVASVFTNGSVVEVIGVSAGSVTVMVTATDPGGLSATAKWDVRVFDQVLPFRDDFDSGASLENWEVQEFTTAGINNGKLRLTNTDGKWWGFVRRPFWATDWMVTARMGNVTKDSWVQLVIQTAAQGAAPNYYYLQVGEDPDGVWKLNGIPIGGNWRLLGRERGRLTLIAHGSSDAVADLGQLMDVTLSVKDDTLSAVIGDEEVFSSAELGAHRNTMVNLWLAVWPRPGKADKTGIFEWFEVTGSAYGDANVAYARTGGFLGSARLPTVNERPRRLGRRSGGRVQGRVERPTFPGRFRIGPEPGRVPWADVAAGFSEGMARDTPQPTEDLRRAPSPGRLPGTVR